MTNIIIIITILVLIGVFVVLFIFLGVPSDSKTNTHREACDHDWVPDYDPAYSAQIYNDGFDHVTDRYICSNCGKKKKGEIFYV